MYNIVREKNNSKNSECMKKEKLFIAVLIFLFCATFVSAQIFKSSRNNIEDSFFSVDYALFKAGSEDKTARLETYYQILNAALHFEEVGKSFEAKYKITVELFKDSKKYDSFTYSQVVRVAKKSKTTSRFDYRTNQVNFYTDEGKYEIIAKLYDPVSNEEIIRKFKVKVKKYKNKKPSISDIEMVQGVAPITDKSTVFDKGENQLIPSVRNKFGISGNSSIYFYLELYQGSEQFSEVRVETVLRHEGKGMLYRDSLTSVFHSPIERQFRKISIEDLRPGKYELIITLRGKRNKKIAAKYKDFEIAWTPEALIRYDYKKLVKQIELIASKEELKGLKNKETYEERLAAFNKYWDSQDPTPGTFENEAKNEFYRRVAVANHNFSFLFGNGWRTDRGRIYIMYGQPDQIDDFPVVSDRRPYQEWYYYQNSKYLKFVFVDINEDGDYRLVYPYDGLYQRQ